MQDFGNTQRLMLDRIRRLEVRLGSIAIGNKIAPTAYSGILPLANGGTASIFGPLGSTPMFLNNTGGVLNNGDVVVLDFTAARRIDDTTTARNPKVAGVVKGTGPFANGAETPVLVSGYHTALKVNGAVVAGDFLATGTNAVRASSIGATAGAGAFAMAFTANASGNGTVEAMVFPSDLLRAFQEITAAGQLLVGSGLGVMDNLPAPGANSQVLVADSAQSLKMLWRLLSVFELSGVANPAGHAGEAVIVNPAANGFIYSAAGGGAATQILETGGPQVLDIAAIPVNTFLKRTANTVVGVPIPGGIQYDPRLAPAAPNTLNDEFDTGALNVKWTPGSNQMNIELYGGATLRLACGMLNGTQAIINGPAGFSGHNRTYVTGNVGEIWLMIQHDSGTGMDGWVSADGMIWTRLTGMTSAGTITLIRLVAVAFSSSNAEGWWDFFRYFPGVRTFTIGGTP
jgi:hypothetical protein